MYLNRVSCLGVVTRCSGRSRCRDWDENLFGTTGRCWGRFNPDAGCTDRRIGCACANTNPSWDNLRSPTVKIEYQAQDFSKTWHETLLHLHQEGADCAIAGHWRREPQKHRQRENRQYPIG